MKGDFAIVINIRGMEDDPARTSEISALVIPYRRTTWENELRQTLSKIRK
jgi:hypothetical protein